MRKIFSIALLFIFLFNILSLPVYAQSSTLPQCPPGGSGPYLGKVQVGVDPANRARTLPADLNIGTGTLLSDDREAIFTIDVNRDNNTTGLGVNKWYMQWQCGGAILGRPDEINKPGQTLIAEAQPSAGNNNIFVDVRNSGTADNRCEFDPKNNPLSIHVIAKLNSGNNIDFCQASYQVFDADALCTLNIVDSSGATADQITPNSDLQVTGTGLTSGGHFVLLFDNNPIWSAMQTKGLIYKQQLFINPNSPLPPSFNSGYVIDKKDLTIGQHHVSLNRIVNNGLKLLLPGTYYPEIDNAQLCSVTFSVGDASNPGKIVNSSGGTLTTTSNIPVPCVGDSCAKSAASACSTPGTGIATAVGCIQTTPAGFVKDFLTFILGLAGGLAFLMMLLGAFGMLTSAGNPEALATGKDRFTNAIIGLLFIIFAVLLMQIIGFDILRLPGFGR